MVRERQCVRRAERVIATPSAEPSLAEEYCAERVNEIIKQTLQCNHCDSKIHIQCLYICTL